MDRRKFLKAGMGLAALESSSRLLNLQAAEGAGFPSQARPVRDKAAGDDELIDLSQATIVSPQEPSRREQKAVQVLVEEIEKRTGIRLPVTSGWPATPTTTIVVGSAKTLREFDASLMSELTGPHLLPFPREAYYARVLRGKEAPKVIVAGSDERGVLFGGSVKRGLLGLSSERGGISSMEFVTKTARSRTY
ncbi:MAG: alpha-glucuronidase family glycosyl hydrolase [Acidobacteriota bacterium]